MEISWLLKKNLKEGFYHLYQHTVLLKIIYICDFRVEISFMHKVKAFDFKKASFKYHGFSVAIYVFLRICGERVKVFVSQGWLESEITVHTL